MASKRPKKRARKEDGGDCNLRKGVTWREGTNRYVVEMRPPKWIPRLHFGSYPTWAEAMVARDYGAFLRASEENVATAGGFRAADHKLYQFEESSAIFESMEETKARRREFVPLNQQVKEWKGDGDPPHIVEFRKAAKKDIIVAIRKIRQSCPHVLNATFLPAETERGVVPKVEPIHAASRGLAPDLRDPGVGAGEILTSGFDDDGAQRSPPSIWECCSDMPVQVAVVVNGSVRTLLDMKVLCLDAEQVIMIINGSIGKIKEHLDRASFDKFLEKVEPCDIDPASIPAIEVSDSDHSPVFENPGLINAADP